MSNGEERKREVPEVKETFANLLKKFRVGVGDGMAEMITEDVCTPRWRVRAARPDRMMASVLYSRHWCDSKNSNLRFRCAIAIGLKRAVRPQE